MRRLAAAFGLAWFCACACGLGLPAHAAANDPADRGKTQGRPKITLDRLDLTSAPLAQGEEKYLRTVLAREARNADWGAGRGAHVEYRVRIDELSLTEETNVLRVRCSATGFLPKGRNATSHLAFGGEPKDRAKLVEHVLEIVARGVVTRLADLERRRRGD
jgi:hypothetical protein